MALAHSPKIVTDGLVLCLDAGNYKSHLRYSSGWSGTYGSATNSFDGSTSTASGAVGGTFSATYTFPTPLITSSSTVRIFTDLGASSGQVGSTVNIILINGVDITQKLKNAGAYAGSAQWIDITTEVGGVFKTIQLNGTSGVSNPGIYAVEVGGQVLVDSVTWTDLSGNGNNGTLNGAGYNSANGGSISFDGSDDYINCGSNSSLGLSALTLSAWVKASSDVSNYRGIIMDESPNGAPWNYRLYMSQSSGVVVFDVNGGGYSGVSSTYAINNNQWYHICAVRTAPGGTQNLYINGILNNSGSDGTTISTLANAVWIGQSAYTNGAYPFNGNISQVSIYNRALTSQEIQQNFNALRGRYGI